MKKRKEKKRKFDQSQSTKKRAQIAARSRSRDAPGSSYVKSHRCMAVVFLYRSSSDDEPAASASAAGGDVDDDDDGALASPLASAFAVVDGGVHPWPFCSIFFFFLSFEKKEMTRENDERDRGEGDAQFKEEEQEASKKQATRKEKKNRWHRNVRERESIQKNALSLILSFFDDIPTNAPSTTCTDAPDACRTARRQR